MSAAQLVRFFAVEPAQQGSNPWLGTICLDLLQDLTGAILSMVGDMLVNSETLLVTSSILSILRICMLSLLDTLIEVSVQVLMFNVYRGECACIY